MDLLEAAIAHLILINDKNSRYEHDPEEAARDEIDGMSNCELLELISRLKDDP